MDRVQVITSKEGVIASLYGAALHTAPGTITFGAFWGVGVGRLPVRVQDHVEEGDGGRDAVAQAAFDDCLGPPRLHE